MLDVDLGVVVDEETTVDVDVIKLETPDDRDDDTTMEEGVELAKVLKVLVELVALEGMNE